MGYKCFKNRSNGCPKEMGFQLHKEALSLVQVDLPSIFTCTMSFVIKALTACSQEEVSREKCNRRKTPDTISCCCCRWGSAKATRNSFHFPKAYISKRSERKHGSILIIQAAKLRQKKGDSTVKNMVMWIASSQKDADKRPLKRSLVKL